jgi:hypothetical protein
MSGPEPAKPAASRTHSSAPGEGHPKFRPHRRLFFWLCVAYAIWMIALIVLYFVTVYPLRHPSSGTRPGALDIPSAPR